jgi:hypothetical protein
MYTRVESRFWQDEKMRNVSDDARYLMLYLLTSPHRNVLGFYFLPEPYACFDLGWTQERFRERLGELLRNGLVKYDETAHVVLIVNFLKHNPLENHNQVKSAIQKLDEIPKTPLLKDFYEAVKKYSYGKSHYSSLLEQLEKQLQEQLGKRLEEPFGKQEKEKEEEKEEEIYICSSADADVCVSIPAEKPSDTLEDGGAQSSVKTGKDGYTPEFEEFWDHYPRKVEKKRAFRVWKARLREGVKPETLIQACKNYAAYCMRQGIEPRYIKHPSTFLGPDKPFEEYVDGIPADIKARAEPKSWDVLRQLYREYEEQERGDEP